MKIELHEIEKKYCVYIMTNHSGTLYTGMSNDLVKRVYEHKQLLVDGFSKRYRINRLVYFEQTQDVESAIQREREIKGRVRSKKIALIESINPGWEDLSEGWFEK